MNNKSEYEEKRLLSDRKQYMDKIRSSLYCAKHDRVKNCCEMCILEKNSVSKKQPITKKQIKIIRLSLYKAIESYESLIDLYKEDSGLTKFKDLDMDTQKMIKYWKYRIKQFKKLFEELSY